MIKYGMFLVIILAANIAGSKGVLFHKYIKQAYAAASTEWHEADKQP